MASKVPLKDIVGVLRTGPNVFTNKSQLQTPFRGRSVFGGTICAQALHSAIKTIPSGFIPHSLHSLFILGGDPSFPIEYRVETLRDGASYASREVKGYQKGNIIFSQLCSFTLKVPKRKPEVVMDHGRVVPNEILDSFDQFLTPWESFKHGVLDQGYMKMDSNEQELAKVWVNSMTHEDIDQKYRDDYWAYGIDPHHRTLQKDPDDIALDNFWRINKPIEEELLNYVIFTYISDELFLSQSPKFYNRPGWTAKMSASLDHSIHFHKSFNVNDWLLYHVRNPKAGNSRMLLEGELFDLDKNLLASVVQEGVTYHGEKKSIEEYRNWFKDRILSAGEYYQENNLKAKL